MREVQLLDHPFSPGTELERFRASHIASGGIVSFAGQVRSGDGVNALELSHYEPLTLPGMNGLVDEALRRWSLDGVLVIHRVGLMKPGEAIVMVAAASRHRRDSFEAADFIMDHLKSDAWFWKREKRADGWHWIEPRASDHEDIGRWA